METQRLVIKPGEDLIRVDDEAISRSALLDQLERLVESRHFRNSKRYPTFLRFVVEHTLAGHPDSLKERNLGVDVFARPSDYDTNADPIVRVTAGEIRKRLAQYYQEPGHEHELRIDLPLGTYVPHFVAHAPGGPSATALPSEPVSAHKLGGQGAGAAFAEPVTVAAEPDVVPLQPAAAPPRRRHGRLWIMLGAVATVLLVGLGWLVQVRRARPGAGLNYVWQPLLASSGPTTVVMGVHTLDSQGNEEQVESHAAARKGEPVDMLSTMVRSDMVPISDIVSYSHVTDLLTSHRHAYTTVGSADASLEELRKGPLILIGGLDNLWTLRMTSKLRFGFTTNGIAESAIVDHEHPETLWRFNNLQHAIVNTRDYAIVASYFDTTIDQPVVIVAGMGKTGTQVAAEFMTTDVYLAAWLQQARLPANKNVEIVLSTQILDGKAGPPRIIASTTW